MPAGQRGTSGGQTDERLLSRRDLLGLAGVGFAGAIAAACEKATRAVTHGTAGAETAASGRLTARPRARVVAHFPPGLHRVPPEREEDALLYVPVTYRPDRGHQLVVMLHGAGGSPRNGLEPLLALADEARLILLAPKSQRDTWDVIRGGYGADVAAIDRALERVFARCRVDPHRVAIGGFSDGASYALSVGLTNGELFTAVIAFSPGFSAPARRRGTPAIFVSHGIDDRVLPIARTSRRLVPRLRADYRVRYREFSGAHTVPPEIAREAVAWLGASASP